MTATAPTTAGNPVRSMIQPPRSGVSTEAGVRRNPTRDRIAWRSPAGAMSMSQVTWLVYSVARKAPARPAMMKNVHPGTGSTAMAQAHSRIPCPTRTEILCPTRSPRAPAATPIRAWQTRAPVPMSAAVEGDTPLWATAYTAKKCTRSG